MTVSADYTTPPPYLQTVGYYDGVIFHRVVPGFLVQTGDRTGTGGGGESFYGDQFEDEVHPRLKFPHRGIVAMANSGEKDTNDSQFFITLGSLRFLHLLCHDTSYKLTPAVTQIEPMNCMANILSSVESLGTLSSVRRIKYLQHVAES